MTKKKANDLPATTYEVVKALGGRAAAAAALGCTVENIDKWHQNGIPGKHWAFVGSKIDGLTLNHLAKINKAAAMARLR